MAEVLLDLPRYNDAIPIGIRRLTSPFDETGDNDAIVFARDYLQRFSKYKKLVRGTPDEVYANAFLCLQSDPIPTGIAGLVRFTRIYASIPAQQTEPNWVPLSKPSPGLAAYPGPFGSYRVFQPDTTLQRFDAYLAKTVTSESGIPGFYPTGGTYTLTFGGATTAGQAFGATNVTIQAALNGLAAVSNRGNCVVTGTYNSAGGFTVTFNDYAVYTVDTSGLTFTGAFSVAKTISISNGGYVQNVWLDVAPGAFTGGTFTITIFGQTTAAIAYDATAATVQAALNALSEVSTKRGGVTVTIPPTYTTILRPASSGLRDTITFSFAFANAAITTDATSLTPAGSAITVAIQDGAIGKIQKLTFSSPTAKRTLFSAGHGLADTDTLYVKGDAAYLAGQAGNFSVLDVDNVRFTVTAGTILGTAAAITEVGKRTKQNYEPGVADILGSNITDFYLPGAAGQPATIAAIPRPTNQSDGAALLTAIYAGTGDINIAVGRLTRYRGPILQVTKTTVSASDV